MWLGLILLINAKLEFIVVVHPCFATNEVVWRGWYFFRYTVSPLALRKREVSSHSLSWVTVTHIQQCLSCHLEAPSIDKTVRVPPWFISLCTKAHVVGRWIPRVHVTGWLACHTVLICCDANRSEFELATFKVKFFSCQTEPAIFLSFPHRELGGSPESGAGASVWPGTCT